MHKAQISDHTYFYRNAAEEIVIITVEPDLARMVLGSRLVPSKYKRAFLESADRSASSFLVDYAMESELFRDIMLRLGIMAVQKATTGDK